MDCMDEFNTFRDCAVETISSLCKNQEVADQLWKLSCEAIRL